MEIILGFVAVLFFIAGSMEILVVQHIFDYALDSPRTKLKRSLLVTALSTAAMIIWLLVTPVFRSVGNPDYTLVSSIDFVFMALLAFISWLRLVMSVHIYHFPDSMLSRIGI